MRCMGLLAMLRFCCVGVEGGAGDGGEESGQRCQGMTV